MGVACCKEEAIDFSAEIELSHFHLLRSVGKGAFGKVRVVQHKKTREIYALKYINKAKCIRMKAVENIIQERRLLEEVEFSLICNLRYAFQDDENLFMILDLMLGGDLRFHLERAGPMREDVVRFYVAEMALALDALHTRHIIHRDLKPDNVLLDEHGHAHLTDFNIAVYYHPSKPLLSIAGSMAYMAPEILLRKGYFESVDWWSLGVVMFELLFGKRPFRGKSNELLTNSILRDPLPFPDNVHGMVSAQCLDVLGKLCERDISKRLGCTQDGLDAFKKHPWFKDIEWDKLVTKEAIPPFEPDSKRANFDATHELEELLMEDNPLKAKKRAQTTPETELSVEMQMMEDKFLIYDFSKVKRSHSLTRGRILRSGTDPKMTSGTLDGIVTKSNSNGRHSSRIEYQPMITPPPNIHHRPESLSDRVGQDRYNPDEEHISLTENMSYKNYALSNPSLNDVNDPFRSKNESTEKSGQQQPYKSSPYYSNGDGLQSESIVVPPSSLPRPLQSKDHAAGYRAGVPRNYPVNQSTSPSSPSTSASSSVTMAAFHNPLHGKDMFPCPDSGTSLSSLGAATPIHPMVVEDSANAQQLPVATRRAVRGRESSGNFTVNSMPTALPGNPRLSSLQGPSPFSPAGPNRRPLNEIGQQHAQYQQQFQPQAHQLSGRPVSAYSASPARTQK
ncbi:hypothetical protein BGW38_003466 [Lunasporangiospora selenospora]|uniref:Serine/threonine protein kinase n=1 Tax=Lunasporangiospora selenospora TaxID=979761 RepID=A0A9P6G1P1_9FUNG|nr:hypothetical protein BGW38_003466 [Lunasporangiospora selenospora]